MVSPLGFFHCRLHPLPTQPSSTRRLIGWRMATHETRFPTVPAHRSGLRSMRNHHASCWTVRMNCSILSPGSGTYSRSPAIRWTAFNAQPPDLPLAPSMVKDFAITSPHQDAKRTCPSNISITRGVPEEGQAVGAACPWCVRRVWLVDDEGEGGGGGDG
jgi:hypothetical protein